MPESAMNALTANLVARETGQPVDPSGASLPPPPDPFPVRLHALLMVGGGGPRDPSGLSIHDCVRDRGYEAYGNLAGDAIRGFKPDGVIVKALEGTWTRQYMDLDAWLYTAGSGRARAVAREGMQACLATIDGAMNYVADGRPAGSKNLPRRAYVGSVSDYRWAALTRQEMAAVVEAMAPIYDGWTWVVDGLTGAGQDKTCRTNELLCSVLDEMGIPYEGEPTPRLADGNPFGWTTMTTWVRSVHLAQMDAGKTTDAQGRPIAWVAAADGNGPQGILVEQPAPEPSTADLVRWGRRGFQDIALGVTLGSINFGTWTPGSGPDRRPMTCSQTKAACREAAKKI